MTTRQMHIGLVGPLPPPFGGMANQTHPLAELLHGEGRARVDLKQLVGVVPHSSAAKYVAAINTALQPAAVPYTPPLKLFIPVLRKVGIAPLLTNTEEVLNDEEDTSLSDATVSGALDASLTRRLHISASTASTISEQGLAWQHNAARVTALTQH